MKPRRNIRRNDIAAYWPFNSKRDLDEAKRLASMAVTNGLRLGTLVRQPCEVCQDPESEAHHPNYNYPLLVEWLCRLHHRERDKAMPSIQADEHRVDVRKVVYRPRRKVGRDLVAQVTGVIRDEMDAQGLTQGEFARLLGVSGPRVSNLFSSGFKTFAVIDRAADVLGLDLTFHYVPKGGSPSPSA